MEAGRRGMSTSIATDGYCDGESNVNTAIVVFLSSHMKGTLTRANAILQKIRVTSLTGHKTRIMLSIYTVLLRGSVVFYSFVYSVTMGRMFKPMLLCGDRNRYQQQV